MKRLTICAALLGAGLLSVGAAAAQDADGPDLSGAYAVCVGEITARIEAAGGEPKFPAMEEVFNDFGDEFSFNFMLGSIEGVDYAEPHEITMLNQPVGSCWAYKGQGKFSRIILDGKVIEDAELSFAE